MSRTAQEAAAARAAAAKNETATSRLSALEVERQGYVQRRDDDGIAAVDEEIARYSRELRIPLDASTTSTADSDPESEEDPGPDLEEVKELIRPLVIEILHEAGILGDPEPTPEAVSDPVVPAPNDPAEPTGDVVPELAPAPEPKRRQRRSAAVAADEPDES